MARLIVPGNSSCSLFKEQKVQSKRSREKIPTKGGDWCAKKIPGNFIRCLLTLDFTAAMQVQDIQVCSHELEHFDRAPGISRHVLDFDEVLPTLLVLADHARGELEFRALETERFHSAKDVEGGAIDCAW